MSVKEALVGVRVVEFASIVSAGQSPARRLGEAEPVVDDRAGQVVSGAIQTLGGYGDLEAFGLAKIYRDVRISQTYEGASDIQRMIIARTL